MLNDGTPVARPWSVAADEIDPKLVLEHSHRARAQHLASTLTKQCNRTMGQMLNVTVDVRVLRWHERWDVEHISMRPYAEFEVRVTRGSAHRSHTMRETEFNQIFDVVYTLTKAVSEIDWRVGRDAQGVADAHPSVGMMLVSAARAHHLAMAALALDRGDYAGHDAWMLVVQAVDAAEAEHRKARQHQTWTKENP